MKTLTLDLKMSFEKFKNLPLEERKKILSKLNLKDETGRFNLKIRFMGYNKHLLIENSSEEEILELINELDSLSCVANRPKNVYIAGPMTGLKDFNYEAFRKTALELKIMGFHPVHTANLPRGMKHSFYMEISLKLLTLSDYVVVLPGYEKSKGALEEISLAKKYDIPIFYVNE